MSPLASGQVSAPSGIWLVSICHTGLWLVNITPCPISGQWPIWPGLEFNLCPGRHIRYQHNNYKHCSQHSKLTSSEKLSWSRKLLGVAWTILDKNLKLRIMRIKAKYLHTVRRKEVMYLSLCYCWLGWMDCQHVYCILYTYAFSILSFLEIVQISFKVSLREILSVLPLIS